MAIIKKITQNVLLSNHKKNTDAEPNEYDIKTTNHPENMMPSSETDYFNTEHYYHYEHPDYSVNLHPIKAPFDILEKGYEDSEYDIYKKISQQFLEFSHKKQVSEVNNILMTYLHKWNTKEDDNIRTYPVWLAAALIEVAKLHECLPTLLELLRQNIRFMSVFFKDENLDIMIPGILYQTITKDDLPELLEFMKTPGLLFESKKFIALAVATLPRKDCESLKVVQDWLNNVITYYFPIGPNTDMFDEELLEVIAFCCIHTHNVDMKDTLIKLYNKYKIPNILIKDGANGMRKNIKKAAIGALTEDEDSGELILRSYLLSLLINDEDWDDDDEDWDDDDEDWDDDDEDWDDDDEDWDDDDEDWDDDDEDWDEDDDDDEDWNEDDDDDEDWDEDDDDWDEDFNIDEYKWNEYRPYAICNTAIYKPTIAISQKMFRIHVALLGIKPEIYRDIEVPSNITLASLAGVILVAMGWEEDHLHQFVTLKKRPTYYASSLNEINNNLLKSKDGTKFCIGELLKKINDIVIFEYDYGDSWQHTLTLTEVNEIGDNPKVSLLDGKNACPPEDCGGVPGYYLLCDAMKDINNEQSQEIIEMAGCKFDPNKYPLEKAKKIIDNFNK